MEQVKLLNKIDMYRALYNGVMEKLCTAEIDSEFYSWKEDHLNNGQTKQAVRSNKQQADQNILTARERLSIIHRKISQLENAADSTN